MPIIEKAALKTDVPDFSAGDTVKVYQRIKERDGEKEKERIQVFEGLVIARHGKIGISSTFIVRKVASGVGVERIFPLHSPSIAKIEVTRPGSASRSKLYYVRGRGDNQPRFRKQPANR